MSEIVMMPTRRCKRCGRLLFSKDALKKGYGCLCAKHVRQDELDQQPIEGQMSLLDFSTENEEETHEGIEDNTTQSEQKNNCIIGASPFGRCGAAFFCSKPFRCCMSCLEDCNIRCGWATDPRAIQPK